MTLPQLDIVDASIGKLAGRLTAVDTESVPVDQGVGRILAAPLLADRDSPALDVSAMDGYAIRRHDVRDVPLPVQATTPAGSAPLVLDPGNAIRIFTGAPVPQGAECVVKREDTLEAAGEVSIKLPAAELVDGLNIRRKGENTLRGQTVLEAGACLGSAATAAVASFGSQTLEVRRRVRLTLLNTGDELVPPGKPVEPWQIRDCNGPILDAWITTLPWVELVHRRHVGDRFEDVVESLNNAMRESDAVILTGGVSMGDADYVPAAIEEIGGEIVFHRLPIRPGRPILGAAHQGKLILGLPGNPVSVAVTSRVFGMPLLNAKAGARPLRARPVSVPLCAADEKHLNLIWYRLVEAAPDGGLGFVPSRGSGDLVSMSRSSGFIEIPPGQSGVGPWPYFRWE